MTTPKTKQELADQYGVSPKTLRRWMRVAGIYVPRGLITPYQLDTIYHKIGLPEKPKRSKEMKQH